MGAVAINLARLTFEESGRRMISNIGGSVVG